MVGTILRRSALLGALTVALSGGPAMAEATVDEVTTASAGTTLDTSGWVEPVTAAGDFVADVDMTSFTFREVPGGCLLTVDGTLVFSGTLEGTATGTTTALVFAPCAEVQANPPGTYADLFRFEGTFTGTVAGVPVTAPLGYAGVTYPGGVIDAAIWLGGDIPLAARADARVAVGGSYTGAALA